MSTSGRWHPKKMDRPSKFRAEKPQVSFWVRLYLRIYYKIVGIVGILKETLSDPWVLMKALGFANWRIRKPNWRIRNHTPPPFPIVDSTPYVEAKELSKTVTYRVKTGELPQKRKSTVGPPLGPEDWELGAIVPQEVRPSPPENLPEDLELGVKAPITSEIPPELEGIWRSDPGPNLDSLKTSFQSFQDPKEVQQTPGDERSTG